MEKDLKEKLAEKTLFLYTENGTVITMEYKIDKEIEDFIVEDLEKAIKNKDLFYSEIYSDCDIRIKENRITVLDCGKIIGYEY